MTKKNKLILSGVAASAAVTFLFAADSRLKTRIYDLESGKLTESVRLALITDLHSCDYGVGQRELLDAVEAQNPDAVLLGGDIVDDEARLPRERAYETIRLLAARWPTYYVTGNHEILSGEADLIRTEIASLGAIPLAGTSAMLERNGQEILIAGLDDPAVGEELWERQFNASDAETDKDTLSVLLTHRPERTNVYASSGFDLVLAGHAHGGQWRIPGLLNGLLAPNQGFFPAYAGGTYDLGGPILVVSRGLARESTRIPRIWNRPELVILNLLPAKK